MAIKTKIIFMVLLAAVLLIITGIILSNSEKKRALYFEKEDIASSFSKGVFELNLLTNDFRRHPLKRTRRQWNQKYNSLMEIVRINEPLFQKEVFYLKKIEQALIDLKTIFLKLNKKNPTKGWQAPLQNDDSTFLLYEARLSTLSQNVINSAEVLKTLIHSQSEISQKNANRTILLLFVFYLVLVVLFSWMVFNSVLKPVTDLVKSSEIIGKGNFKHEIRVSRKDEIGVLSTAFNEMTKRLNDITVNRSELIKEIDERKKAEREIRDSQELFKAIFEQTGGYCLLLQPTDSGIPTILDANEAACRAHGYTRNELIGRPVADLDDEDGKRLCRERTKKILSGQTLVVENDHVRKDGSLFPVAVFANRIDFEDKPPIIVSTEFDISEKKKAEAEKRILETHLQQAQKMESIGKLAGGIAHDFNNVLYPIIGFTQMSMEDLPKTHPVQENLKDILNGSKRARDLVKQILLFSRQKEQVLNPCFLKPLIEEALKLIRVTIPANIDIEASLYDGKDYVLCDETEIHEVVMNLCTNAYHSMELTGGKIKIGLDKIQPDPHLDLPMGKYICLSISDNGAGIPDKIKDKIFEPYYTTKEIGKGSGLGLSVVHGIVKNYKGGIDIENSQKKGATFNIFLPIAENTIEIKDELEKENRLFGTERILFVDDEKPIVKLGVRSLERIGYTVTGVQNSKKALTLFESHPNDFDLVITDMAMPGMEGTELAQKIFKIRPDMPIILCSGFSNKIDQEKAKQFNIRSFIDKPILMDDLVTEVREILDEIGRGQNA